MSRVAWPKVTFWK